MNPSDHDKSCCEVVAAHENITKELLGKMPPEEDLYDLADFFKVFGDSTRVKILYLLLCSEMCVGHIAATLGMTQSAISHQLRFLKQMKLVAAKREGKTIFYSLADAHIESILSQGYEHIKE
jgi:ArsR family transcriptional regulator